CSAGLRFLGARVGDRRHRLWRGDAHRHIDIHQPLDAAVRWLDPISWHIDQRAAERHGRGGDEQADITKLADLNRVRRRHQPQRRSPPRPAEEAPYRAHALQIVLVPAAIDDGNEALGQFVDVGDERDAADERIEAGLHQGPQPRLDKQPKKENAAEDDEEAEEVGARVRGGEIEPEQDDKPADQAVGSGVVLSSWATQAVTMTVTRIGKSTRSRPRRCVRYAPNESLPRSSIPTSGRASPRG